MSDLPSLLATLSIDGGERVDAQKVVNHVQSEPKILKKIMPKLIEQISLGGKGSECEVVVAALKVLETLANNCMLQAEAVLCHHLPDLLKAAGNKAQKPIRDAADTAITAICTKMNANSVEEVLPALFAATETGQPWQSRALALKLISSFGDNAPEQLGFMLPAVVPEVTKSMSEPKKEVSTAAFQAMTNACNVIGNRDIEHMTDKIVRSISNPEEVPEIMHALAGVTFVQSVQSPALAMVVPLLLRGLRSKVTATRRQSAVIIDNMSKLVDDPIDAAPFLPILMPALQFAADAMSDPGARNIAERASAQLSKLSVSCEEAMKLQKNVDAATVKDAVIKKIKAPKDTDLELNHIVNLICMLMHLQKFDEGSWEGVQQFMAQIVGADASKKAVTLLRPECREMTKPEPPKDDEDDAAETLCDCQFTLAYGTKILLHNTTMRLKRGAKYGLLGGNESGKTTLMRSIANGSVEGFPDAKDVRTVFVEADILGELSHLSCVQYVLEDSRLKHLPEKEVREVMASVGFTEDGKAKPDHAVSTLSGGWRMKLAMARAMLQQADILLLDEPTNHLDVINVAWVKNYINSLTNVTAIMVSHDSGFLNDCCTHILQIERLKLKTYKGNLAKFIEVNPDAKAYFSIKESKLKFKFPQPGPIEGVKSRSKALMKMSHCDFTYPGNTKPTLFDISIQVSMASRVGCVGENGAGKSTMIKVLTGEVVPQTGDVWKHPNARVAYVAQHAFHHIEAHLNKTPNEYIRWRYSNGEDKESLVKVSMVLSDEEAALQKEAFEVSWIDDDGKPQKAKKTVIELLGARRENKQKEYEYEVKYRDGSEGYLRQKILNQRGWEKSCKTIDARLAQRAGLNIRTLSSANVENHLADCGLAAEFGTHYRMSALSGGQKVKVVMAACMWNQPHILILDEPTNYLDRESLGALAGAISDYEGGVVIISHNNEFVSTLCPEEWVMDAGHLTTKGVAGWMNRQDDKISDAPVITEMTDALGNVTEVKQAKKKLSTREVKAQIKAIAKKIKLKMELDEEEEEFAEEHGLLT
jgi:elongation factor 3